MLAKTTYTKLRIINFDKQAISDFICISFVIWLGVLAGACNLAALEACNGGR